MRNITLYLQQLERCAKFQLIITINSFVTFTNENLNLHGVFINRDIYIAELTYVRFKFVYRMSNLRRVF